MKDKILQPLVAVLGGFCGFLYGDMNALLIALIVFISFDYATGLMCGVALKNLSSATGFKGIAKKVCILIFVSIAHIIDVVIIGNGAVIMSAVECFYIANEGISILENGGKLGLKLPPKLLEILKQLQNESEEKK